MKVGFVGAGKLGLPVATALQMCGHDVYVYDVNPEIECYITSPGILPYRELGPDNIEPFGLSLAAYPPKWATIEEVCNCEVVFAAVQTPHAPAYEGITPAPLSELRDFNYFYLRVAIDLISQRIGAGQTVAVISTCLPGTMKREVLPRLRNADLVYNPSFIAMGTTMRDFLRPEFVLLGGDDPGRRVARVYEEARIGPIRRMSIESAELAKVVYNTAITAKINVAQTTMELCQKTGADVDDVMGALKAADRRITSGAYLDGGMGDGGGCHPRDLIAMAWLADEKCLQRNMFLDMVCQREAQAAWFASLILGECQGKNLEPRILGYAYKPQSDLIEGSHALLVACMLEQAGKPTLLVDANVDPESLEMPEEPYVFFIGCKHPEYSSYKFPKRSVVIDPFRYIPDQKGVRVIRLGEGK